MAHFFRDQRISNMSIDVDKLTQINAIFVERARTLNALVPENDNTGRQAFLTYIIRFDNKGYRVFSFGALVQYFHQAKEIERVIFTVETGESLRTNRQTGTYLELRLDEKDNANCYLGITSDDMDWVDASFSAVQDVLVNCKNKNGWVHTAWTPLVVQIIGVTLGFALSLWAAAKISPKLAIENSFIISFLFVIMIFSNTWMYINQRLLFLINALFPNIKFYRSGRDRKHWLMQAVVAGIAVAVTLYIIGLLFSFFGDILSGFVKKGT